MISARVSLITEESIFIVWHCRTKTFKVNRFVNYDKLVEFKCVELIYQIAKQSLAQAGASIAKWDNFITKWSRYYKVRQGLLESRAVSRYYKVGQELLQVAQVIY